MDRRQRKTRQAIYDAFEALMASAHYRDITVAQIIERADIGRSTFYAHFETKDDLLEQMCVEMFDHIFEGVNEHCVTLQTCATPTSRASWHTCSTTCATLTRACAPSCSTSASRTSRPTFPRSSRCCSPARCATCPKACRQTSPRACSWPPSPRQSPGGSPPTAPAPPKSWPDGSWQR